ncbi:uncharacterized protein LOC143047286 [Mytilus galloprovincialis]|uniref:uncharacterized protein LOC143047286 n=1 Tax=Mytilus galloprovincialis TaxID=29158 RepID=UPI003F7CB652
MLGEKLPIMDGTPHTKLPVFGKHYWRVSEKVPGYGADLTLFCFVDDCCIRSAGWIKWNPDYKTIYVDVRNLKGTVSSKDKYATTNNKTGFSLVIKHLQEDDLNIIYSCSYGFKNSLGKLLHHSEVFKVDETTTHFADERTTTNFKDETSISHFKDETSISHFKEVTDETATALITNAYYRESENNSKSVKIICIVGAVVAVLAIIFIVKFYQRRRLASRNRRKSSEEGQVAQNQLLEKRKEEESANGTTKLGECLNSDDSEDCKSIPYSESSC